jgi:cyanophycinase-like exopeptidase
VTISDDPTWAAALDALPDGAGAIGLLSSEEFTVAADAFDDALLRASGRRVGVVLAADPDSAEAGWTAAESHYRRLGASPVRVRVLRRSEAQAVALPDCDVLFLAGGDPTNVLSALRDTPFWDEALRRWRAGMALAGSSAGAMALCRHCLVPRPGDERPTTWDVGLGPVQRFGLAVHASSRPESWLRQVTATAPVAMIAMDDATGLLLRPGQTPRAIGPGRVRLVEPA